MYRRLLVEVGPETNNRLPVAPPSQTLQVGSQVGVEAAVALASSSGNSLGSLSSSSSSSSSSSASSSSTSSTSSSSSINNNPSIQHPTNTTTHLIIPQPEGGGGGGEDIEYSQYFKIYIQIGRVNLFNHACMSVRTVYCYYYSGKGGTKSILVSVVTF